MSQNNFLLIFKNANPIACDNIELLSDFINYKTKIKYKCKICGEIKETYPYELIIYRSVENVYFGINKDMIMREIQSL